MKLNNQEVEIQYNKDKMLRFIEKDRLLAIVYKDLMKRGHLEDEALKIVFNSYILEDSVMEFEYMNL